MTNNKYDHMTVSVSRGTTKMGAVPSISLPAVKTCRAGAPCARKCYAAKLERIRPTVRAAYQRNLDLWLAYPVSFERQAIAAAKRARAFRWHVSGDIISADYLSMMVRVAIACPDTHFLAFSKQFEIVNAWIDAHGPLPANLQIILSAWAGLDLINPYDLPTAHVLYRDGTTTAPAGAWSCGGNCTACICAGLGCWRLKPGESVVFAEH